MIGILPAGGKAERMGGLPKMLLPLVSGSLFSLHTMRMRYAANTLLVDAGDDVAPFLQRELHPQDMLLRLHAPNMSASVLRTRHYMANPESPVLFGMPDTYFDDGNAFTKLAAALSAGADVAVGLFQARPGQHREGGMCRIDGGDVVEVVDKPDRWPSDGYIWGALAWRAAFWAHLREDEPHVGYALPRAIAAGLNVWAVQLSGGFYDCGTPERYFALVRHLTEPRPHVITPQSTRIDYGGEWP